VSETLRTKSHCCWPAAGASLIVTERRIRVESLASPETLAMKYREVSFPEEGFGAGDLRELEDGRAT
jgi:hypothetical protein